MPSSPIIIFTTLLLLFEDYVFLNLKEVITIIALKANLFLEQAKQMGLPFPDICERCPKIVQGADGPEQ